MLSTVVDARRRPLDTMPQSIERARRPAKAARWIRRGVVLLVLLPSRETYPA